VDKRESEKTITIKINGKKQEFEETRQQPSLNTSPVKPKNEESIPFSFHHENEYSGHAESAAAKAEQDESFDWILPEPSETIEIKEFHIAEDLSPKKKSSHFGKRQGSFFKTIFTAVILAVVLGTSFGLIMLKLVLTDNKAETANVGVQGNEPKQTEKQNQNEEKNPSGTLSLVTPKISTFVIQGGAFSNKASAEKEQQVVKDKGSPARIIESDGNSLLLLSVIDNKEHADKLEASFKESGIVNVFDKVLEVGGKEMKGLQQGEKEYLESLPTLFQALTVAGANASLNLSISQSILISVEQQSQKIKAIDNKQFTNEKIKTLKVSTDNALKQFKLLKNKTTKEESTALQQNLLSILSAYHSL
jgi:stage II sporulation protein B